MITVEQALGLLENHLPKEFSARDTLLESLVADRDYPPFDRVMMDGIALSYEVFESGRRHFPIKGVCPAGVPMKSLDDFSTCLEVMTGAPLPQGADLVIPYEHLKIEADQAFVIQDLPRSRFENVHRKGSDCQRGQILLNAGEVLNGPHTGIAASLGYAHPKTSKRPRINIISTGDELVAIEETPLEHQIRCSNAHALRASLMPHGYQDITLSHLLDDQKAIEAHYQKSAQEFDLLIYSGGVSKGKFDYLPQMWKELGVQEIFHGVSQRPGKPLWFGKDEKTQTIILGLPGNPVSSLVCLHRYFLQQTPVYAILDEEIVFKKDLTLFIPVKRSFHKDGTLHATPLKIQNSGEFSALAGSDGFLELPQDQSVFKAGETFLFHSWSAL